MLIRVKDKRVLLNLFNVCFHIELLGIVPAPNNGTEGSLTHILLNPKPLTIDIEAIELCNSSEDDAAPVCGCANKNVSVYEKNYNQTFIMRVKRSMQLSGFGTQILFFYQ